MYWSLEMDEVSFSVNRPQYKALAAYPGRTIIFREPMRSVRHPAICALAMTEIEKLTTDLAAFEKIRKIAFIENGFSIEGGELTPTLKIRRSEVEKKFRLVIDSLYAA